MTPTPAQKAAATQTGSVHIEVPLSCRYAVVSKRSRVKIEIYLAGCDFDHA